MTSRYLLRILCLLPLVLCVGAWIWSYQRWDSVRFFPTPGRLLEAHLIRGRVNVDYGPLVDLDSPPAWATHLHLLGFALDAETRSHRLDSCRIVVPLYAPTLAAAGAFLLAWRITRKPRPLHAFPVEVTATSVAMRRR